MATKIVMAVLAVAGVMPFARATDYFQVRDTANANDKVLSNPAFWKDGSGKVLEEMDPAGDYYTHTAGSLHVNFATVDLNSLSIGMTNTDRAVTMYAYGNATLTLGAGGISLNNGTVWLRNGTMALDGEVTVNAPDSVPFLLKNNTPGAILSFPGSLVGAKGTGLWAYAVQTEDSAQDTDFTIVPSGDCSRYFGNMTIGWDSEPAGHDRKTLLKLGATAFPGTVTLRKSGVLVAASGVSQVQVGGLSLGEGAVVKTRVKVAGPVVQTGTAVIELACPALPNLEKPRVALMTVPVTSALDPTLFEVDLKGVTLRTDEPTVVEDNGDGTKTLYAKVARPCVWVSPTGDDAAAGDEDHPYKTLKKAVSEMTDGIVYAKAGVYDSLVCDEGETTPCRVVVPAKVVLKAVAGPSETAIVGGGSALAGPGAMRCVRLEAGAVIEGFTLRNGYAGTTSSSPYTACAGAGVIGGVGSLAYNCVITSNNAVRGGGAWGGNYVRCRFHDNATPGGSSGTDVFGYDVKTRLFDCLFTATDPQAVPVYHSIRLYNCTFNGGWRSGLGMSCLGYNLLFKVSRVGAGDSAVFNNCLTTDTSGTVIQGCTAVTAAETEVDENLRPVSKTGAAVDSDVAKELYLAGWQEAGIDESYRRDYAGGKRFMNGKLDIGCGEYDWTSDFNKAIGSHHVALSNASSGIEIANDAIVLRNGDSFVLAAKAGCEKKPLRFPVTVNGDGVVTFLRDGAVDRTVSVSEEVVYTFEGETENLKVVFVGGGSASVGKITSALGLLLMVR